MKTLCDVISSWRCSTRVSDKRLNVIKSTFIGPINPNTYDAGFSYVNLCFYEEYLTLCKITTLYKTKNNWNVRCISLQRNFHESSFIYHSILALTIISFKANNIHLFWTHIQRNKNAFTTWCLEPSIEFVATFSVHIFFCRSFCLLSTLFQLL